MDVHLTVGTSEGCVLAARTGDEWRVAGHGLSGQTVTAVAASDGCLWAGTRDGVYRSTNGGQTWQPTSGEQAVPWPRHMVERFLQIDDEILAVLSNGDLLAAPQETMDWQPFLPEVNGVRCAAKF